MSQITKAVIPCGGYATRFLPLTKSVPKEMLPILDKPAIHYIVEELKDAGIKEVLFLIGRGREALQNYFDKNFELDRVLENSGIDIDLNPFSDMKFFFRRVAVPKGPADNIYHAQEFVGDQPFIVAYCDDVFFDGNPTKELINDFVTCQTPVFVACRVDKGTEKNYGIVSLHDCDNNSCIAGRIVEKPQSNPPSNLAACGRYLLTKEIFKFIKEAKEISTDHVCMTAQLNKLAWKKRLRCVQTVATRFDTGNVLGWLAANNYMLGILTSKQS